MDYSNPKKIDPQPKRRKEKDAPYEIFTVGIKTDAPHYYISFRDGERKEICMEINREIFDAFDQFELEDLSYLNEKERHYDSVEFSDDLLGSHAFRKEEMTDEIALTSMQDKALHKAIDGLPELQRRRLIWYYFDEMTFSEIAQREGCEYQAVQESIYRGRERIKKVLTDLRK